MTSQRGGLQIGVLRRGAVAALFLFAAFAVRQARADGTVRAARLTYVQGSVTVSEPGGGESVAAQMNLPLLTGVQVATGQDGEAEVEFEDGSVIRLTPNSALSLDNLAVEGDGTFTTNVTLLQGVVYCELRAAAQFRYAAAAGGDVLSPVENATVRINFDTPPATFAVLDGTAHVERDGGFQTDVRASESLSGDAANPSRYFLTHGIANDSWDQWNDDLDQKASQQTTDSTAVRQDYAGSQGYGWSDLDANGTWYDVPGQGRVWQPGDAADPSFDPYGNGAWVWYPNSGYIWASNYSWGWTPYRCGNWSYYNGFGWGWIPGAACGGTGWGFFGGGRPVNIVVGPTGYRPIRVPVVVGRPVRPILPVRPIVSSQRQWQGRGPDAEPRQIAGVVVRPVERKADWQGHDDGGRGASLRRDYPVDRVTHAPVLGLASTGSTAIRKNSGQGALPNQAGPQPQDGRPVQNRGGQPDGSAGRRQGYVQGQRPGEAGTPAVQGQAPTATPQQPQQRYIAPPQQQQQRPLTVPQQQQRDMLPSQQQPQQPQQNPAPSQDMQRQQQRQRQQQQDQLQQRPAEPLQQQQRSPVAPQQSQPQPQAPQQPPRNVAPPQQQAQPQQLPRFNPPPPQAQPQQQQRYAPPPPQQAQPQQQQRYAPPPPQQAQPQQQQRYSPPPQQQRYSPPPPPPSPPPAPPASTTPSPSRPSTK